jgi:hypothetical protein
MCSSSTDPKPDSSVQLLETKPERRRSWRDVFRKDAAE